MEIHSVRIKDIAIGSFVLVELMYNSKQSKQTPKNFVAQVVQSNCKNQFLVKCMRNYQGHFDTFVFPQVVDEILINFEQITRLLKEPNISRGRHIFYEFMK